MSAPGLLHGGQLLVAPGATVFGHGHQRLLAHRLTTGAGTRPSLVTGTAGRRGAQLHRHGTDGRRVHDHRQGNPRSRAGRAVRSERPHLPVRRAGGRPPRVPALLRRRDHHGLPRHDVRDLGGQFPNQLRVPAGCLGGGERPVHDACGPASSRSRCWRCLVGLAAGVGSISAHAAIDYSKFPDHRRRRRAADPARSTSPSLCSPTLSSPTPPPDCYSCGVSGQAGQRRVAVTCGDEPRMGSFRASGEARDAARGGTSGHARPAAFGATRAGPATPDKPPAAGESAAKSLDPL